jgi:succinyl-diaminopimelate desuccinylase
MKYAGINLAAAEELLSVVVATPSVNPAFQTPEDDPALFGEAKLARALAAWFAANGIEAELEEKLPGRPNLIARIKGRSGGPRMMWEGHLDTVQVTGMDAPFVPVVRDGRLYGRGAVDDGGCVVAFMLAVRALAANPPPGDVDFVGAMDEEFSYLGVLQHLARGEQYALGVAGEPTDLRVVRACKGTVRWFVDIKGRSAHTSKPHEGLSGIDGARRVLELYEAEMKGRTQSHVLLGVPTLTCTAIEAGEGPNTVPSSARLRFDYRYLPTESGSEVYAHFKALAETLPEIAPGFTVTVPPPFVDSSAMDVPEDSAIVTRMTRVCAARGISDVAEGVPYGSDSTKMVNNGGIPTIVFGPGNIDQAHARDEYVELAQVVTAAEMLVDLAHSL